jgi:hypothetical protein
VTVEAPGVEAAEVADAGDGDRDEPIEELPHAVAPQRDLGADGVALAQLEARDRLAGPGDQRLLSGDHGEVALRSLEQRGLRRGGTDAHVHDDLLEARCLHDVAQAQLALQLATQRLLVADLEPRLLTLGRGRCGCHEISPPQRLQTLTFWPEASTL